MYLEQRIEQLENVTVEHGKQIEMIAAGLATLTSTVNNGFEEIRGQFARIDDKFAEHDGRFERIETKLAEHDARFERIETKLAEHDARFDRIDQQFLQVHGVLSELVTLVKNKL